MSANDCPERDPSSWILEAREIPSSIFTQRRAEREIPVSRPIGSLSKVMSWNFKNVNRSLVGAVRNVATQEINQLHTLENYTFRYLSHLVWYNIKHTQHLEFLSVMT